MPSQAYVVFQHPAVTPNAALTEGLYVLSTSYITYTRLSYYAHHTANIKICEVRV